MSHIEVHTQTRVGTMVADLRRQIVAGKLRPGDHMPSVRELARSSGVSAFTAARAYDLLVAEGIVAARRGSGYFVARNAESAKTRTVTGAEPSADSIWGLRRGCDARQMRIDAGCGWLPANWMFAEGLRTALTSVARRPAAYSGRYGSVYGLRALRRHLSTHLVQQAIECTEQEIVLTQGASQALQLCIGVLTKPGDCVLVDDPCYPYVLAMLRQHGVHALGVPRTAAGPDVAALTSIASENKPRLFITNTTFQNPTGSTTTAQTAHDVLLAANRHGFTIVEDDIFAELNSERTPSLASLDRLRNVVYIGSFSKTIGPSLRVGYVVAREELATEIASLKNVLSLSSSELMEQIVLAILTGGRHRTHLERLRRRLSEAHENVTRRFTDVNAQIDTLGGGMFVWAKLPTMLESSALLQLAKVRGILLAPGEVFRPDGRATGHYRFNVAYANDEVLFEFIRSLHDR